MKNLNKYALVASGIFGLFLISGIIGVVLQENQIVTPSSDTVTAIVTNTAGISHALILEVADNEAERAQGLMGRSQLATNAGMLFAFPDTAMRSFWMYNTIISLDIIFLDASQQVVTIHKNTLPGRTNPTYDSSSPSKFVIETNAGWTDQTDVKIGDKFSFISQ